MKQQPKLEKDNEPSREDLQYWRKNDITVYFRQALEKNKSDLEKVLLHYSKGEPEIGTIRQFAGKIEAVDEILFNIFGVEDEQ